jgi:hypothetical protein
MEKRSVKLEQNIKTLPQRFEKEAQTLAQLTNWNVSDIRRKQPVIQTSGSPIQQFWQNIWK